MIKLLTDSKPIEFSKLKNRKLDSPLNQWKARREL